MEPFGPRVHPSRPSEPSFATQLPGDSSEPGENIGCFPSISSFHVGKQENRLEIVRRQILRNKAKRGIMLGGLAIVGVHLMWLVCVLAQCPRFLVLLMVGFGLVPTETHTAEGHTMVCDKLVPRSVTRP